MSEKVYCSVCQHPNQKGDIFCVNCGSNLPAESWDKRIIQEQSQPQISSTTTTEGSLDTESQTITIPKKKAKKKWFKQPIRTRPWYHPLELLFWIGWSFYVFFGSIIFILWIIIKEIGLYIAWCCYWGPPREWKKE